MKPTNFKIVVMLKELWFVIEMSLTVLGEVELKTGSQVFVMNSGQTFKLQCEIQWSENDRKVTDVAVYFLKQQGPDQIRVNIADEILHPFQDTGRMKIMWHLEDPASLLMVLTISNISREDSGNYTCVVEDQISSVKRSRITHHIFVRAVPWMISMSLSYTLNSILQPAISNLSTVFYEQTIFRHRIKNLQRINRSPDENMDERRSDARASRPIRRFAVQQPITKSINKNKPSASESSNGLGKLRFLSRFPTRIYCSSHGGYPIPEISIYFKEKLISRNIIQSGSDANKLSLSTDKLNSSIHYNDSFSGHPSTTNLPINISTIIPQKSKDSREENESYSETKMIFHGKTGFKVVETQVTAVSTALSLTPDDDGAIVTCHVTVLGLKSNVTKRQIVVLHPPIVVCNSAEVSVDDKESVIACLIRSKPDLSSVYWHEAPSHESGNESTHDQDESCNRSVVREEPGIFSPEGMHNTIRVLENGSLLAQLHLRSPQKQHFKKFYLTAENLLGSRTSSAEFIEKNSVPDTSLAQTSKAIEEVQMWKCCVIIVVIFLNLIMKCQ